MTTLLPMVFAATLAAAPGESDYDDVVARLELQRELLTSPPRGPATARRIAARAIVLRAIVDELIPAWYGTPWAYSGTSERPGEGHIACGYFVTTVLRDAGFDVERVRLAQQASEQIVRTLVTSGPTLRFSDRSADDVIEAARRHGDGLWAVGLDNHAGLLVIDGARADFCHSSVLGAAQVVCEPAATSPGFASRYRVIGKLLDDEMIDRWLARRHFATTLR